jgi:hypothetical protein
MLVLAITTLSSVVPLSRRIVMVSCNFNHWLRVKTIGLGVGPSNGGAQCLCPHWRCGFSSHLSPLAGQFGSSLQTVAKLLCVVLLCGGGCA